MHIRPSYLADVGTMIDRAVRVRVACGRCDYFRDADLQAMAAYRGRGFDLVGANIACRDCGHRVLFLYSPFRSTPFLPMTRYRWDLG